jgi:hypothetical protein
MPCCRWCGVQPSTFIAAKDHQKNCPRLVRLGFDLETKVRSGKLSIEAAESEQQTRPELKL